MGISHVADILDSVVMLLCAEGLPDGAVVLPSRVRTDKAQMLINVFPVSDSALADRQGNRAFPATAARRSLVIAVVCRTRGTDTDNEYLRWWAVRQILGDNPLSAIGVASVTEGDTEWRQEIDAKGDYSEAAMTFVVEYVREKDRL